ncbi:hypothetical protein [Gallaecimonas sp. GXIMD4217]
MTKVTFPFGNNGVFRFPLTTDGKAAPQFRYPVLWARGKQK